MDGYAIGDELRIGVEEKKIVLEIEDIDQFEFTKDRIFFMRAVIIGDEEMEELIEKENVEYVRKKIEHD